MTFSTPASADAPRRIRVVLVGDSTVTNQSGWGSAIGGFFNDHVTIINHAAGGRSSKNFINEGRLTKALAEKPDYVFIQFGHNDCPGKGPERETHPDSTYTDYMKSYVEATRKAGAKPILVTSVARRNFKDDGKIKDILAPYAQAVKRIGKELQVPVIDLHTRSIALFERLGDAGGKDLQPEGDRTHFNPKGARVMAELIIKELPGADAELAASLKQSAPLLKQPK